MEAGNSPHLGIDYQNRKTVGCLHGESHRLDPGRLGIGLGALIPLSSLFFYDKQAIGMYLR
jgi:hypothetical protein